MAGSGQESKQETLQRVLTQTILDDLRGFWYQDFKRPEQYVAPDSGSYMRWFRKDQAFDQACIAEYGPVLRAIVAERPTVDTILSITNPAAPLDWVSLVVLLDQLPRNAYRDGPEAFTVFDPLARAVALRAPVIDPYIRFRPAVRIMLLMPLMHSEDRDLQVRATEEYAAMRADVDVLAAWEGDDEDTAACKRALLRGDNLATAYSFTELAVDIAGKHRAVIERFGRYPHRNEKVGREPTAEEVKYLNEGGDTW